MNVASNTQPTYAIVLVNYKSVELTSICLELLKKVLSDSGVQVWVVDNDSNDESTELLRSLDWINLVERKPVANEPGFMAHGEALDMVLEKIDTEYLFLLHTDTFIYDPAVFELMLSKFIAGKNVAAVGCVEQIYRGRTRIVWRLIVRFFKHYSRKLKLMLGLKSKQPKPYFEMYIKSFCALWNARIMKENSLTFTMNSRTPGYEAQDQLLETG